MIRPSYTPGFWSKLNYDQFIDKHKDLEFFQFATDEEKIAEFEKATGKTYVSEKVDSKKPIKKEGE